MQRLILKTSAIAFMLLGSMASFGMFQTQKHREFVLQDNGEFVLVEKQKKPLLVDTLLRDREPFLFDELSKGLQPAVVNMVAKPLLLGQTSIQNYKMVKKLGMDNLRAVYQAQNPRLALSLFVPVLSMNICSSRKEKLHHWVYISPYEKSFYSEMDERVDSGEIKKLGNKRYYQTRKIQNIEYYRESFDHPVVSAALFGDDKDIVKELKKYKEYCNVSDDRHAMTPGHIVWRALNLLIQYPNNKNNAFEILLSDKKDDIAKKNNPAQYAHSFYGLLCLADKYKNREAFAALVAKDPYEEAFTALVAKDPDCAKNLCYRVTKIMNHRRI